MIAAGIEFDRVGEGPAVLCLHGIGGGIESFRSQLDDAAGAGRIGGAPCSGSQTPGLEGLQLIAWNMPGYGRSEEGLWPPTFESLSASLGTFIENLDFGSVCLVGHSIGGMLALEHALRRPDQVTSLVLLGTTPSFGGRDGSFKEAFLNMCLAPLEAGTGMAELARQFAPRLVGPKASANTVAHVGKTIAEVTERTWRGILECLVTFNRRDDLYRLTKPICLIAGGHDGNAPSRTMKRMGTALPSADFHLIEWAGHMIQQEAPEEVNLIIGDFLRGNG